jgi:hypothetical protein
MCHMPMLRSAVEAGQIDQLQATDNVQQIRCPNYYQPHVHQCQHSPLAADKQ